MSDWALYLKERFDWDSIEEDGGFMAYELNPPDAFVREFFVRPEKRGTRLAKQLMDRAEAHAKQEGVTKVWAYVTPGLPGAEQAMRTNLHYGFKLAGVDSNRIILLKEL